MKKDLKAKRELKEALLYDQSNIKEPTKIISWNNTRSKKKKKTVAKMMIHPKTYYLLPMTMSMF